MAGNDYHGSQHNIDGCVFPAYADSALSAGRKGRNAQNDLETAEGFHGIFRTVCSIECIFRTLLRLDYFFVGTGHEDVRLNREKGVVCNYE